jgi:hypothetical protein
MNRVVFDVVVDIRFRASGLRHEIVRLLSENAGGLEEVSVFTEQEAYPLGSPPAARDELDPGFLPKAPPGAYLGRHETHSSGKVPAGTDTGENREG